MRNLSSYPFPPPGDDPDDSPYEDDDEEEEDHPDNSHFPQNGHFNNYDDSKRHPKKRKLESFVSNNNAHSQSRRDTWTEDDVFALLTVWGEKYVELGRRSLRTDDWNDLMEKVLEMSGVERTVAECRSQLENLKNKYKKERAKVESGTGSGWVLYRKMDGLFNARMRGFSGLGCGLDAGEYVFMSPQVYLDRSNVLDEMRDSPVQSDEEGEEEEEAEGGESAKLLAESIQRFGAVYEKIEDNKRKQMLVMEKMRQEFQRELEIEKQQIVERAQAEIAKIREMNGEDDDDDHTDTSVDNLGD